MAEHIKGEYYGKSGPLFGLFLKTSLLTLLTLGFYRFWAKTRIRSYIWSATSGDGDSFEYTGTGLEKLLGFLIAVVILAIYLGLLQLGLAFFGVFLFSEPETQSQAFGQAAGAYLSLLAVVPLIFFAQYRARRYRMARTRWRGLRFGMEPAAMGYVWRAIGHTLLTILTLGLLYPRQSFYLEKYMADRTWYGDSRFEQGGRWQSLYAGLKHICIALFILIVFGGLGLSGGIVGMVFLSVIVGFVWLVLGVAYYRIYALNYMASHKVLDSDVTFGSEARLRDVVKILVIGALALSVTGAIGSAVVGALVIAVLPVGVTINGPLDLTTLDMAGFVLPALLSGAAYIALFFVISGVSLVMITQKILAHVVTNITIHNADHLNKVRQRAADTGADAEGFADALDVGSAF